MQQGPSPIQSHINEIQDMVKPGGRLFAALYKKKQGWVSRHWTAVKRSYVGHRLVRWPLLALHAPCLVGLRWLSRVATGRRTSERGMSLWRGKIDGVGGYPFEVAPPESSLSFYRDRGFVLIEMENCGGRHGCNDFVIVRQDQTGSC